MQPKVCRKRRFVLLGIAKGVVRDRLKLLHFEMFRRHFTSQPQYLRVVAGEEVQNGRQDLNIEVDTVGTKYYLRLDHCGGLIDAIGQSQRFHKPSKCGCVLRVPTIDISKSVDGLISSTQGMQDASRVRQDVNILWLEL